MNLTDITPELERAALTGKWLAPLILGCIAFIGLIGNFLVIFTVCRQKAHRAVTYYYIVNLAVTDVAFLICCAPFTAAEYALPQWIFGDFLCKFSGFMKQVTGLATCTTLTAMTIDRYRAIVHPFRSLQSRTPRAAITVSLCIWAGSCFLALPMLLFKKEVYLPRFNMTVCMPVWPMTQLKTVYNLGTFFATYPIPLTIISICYAILLRKLWKYSISDRETGNGGEARARMMQRKRHVTFMILIVVLGFAICWLPLHSFQIWLLIVRPPHSVVFYYVRLCSLCLAYSNSAVNPIVYAFVGGKFRERFFYACPFFCRYSIVRQETMPLDHVVKDKTTDTGYDTKRTKIVNSSDNTDPKD